MRLGVGEGGLSDPAMWFATDGLNWDGRYQAPEGLSGQVYVESQVVVGPDAIFAVGVDQDYDRIPIVGRLQN